MAVSKLAVLKNVPCLETKLPQSWKKQPTSQAVLLFAFLVVDGVYPNNEALEWTRDASSCLRNAWWLYVPTFSSVLSPYFGELQQTRNAASGKGFLYACMYTRFAQWEGKKKNVEETDEKGAFGVF